jgi:uncharacterized OsmC-like protein
MITTQSTTKRFQTSVSNGRVSLAADPPQDKGGDGEGFGAHELLESALAACMNMAVRMRAVELGIAVPAVHGSAMNHRVRVSEGGKSMSRLPARRPPRTMLAISQG